MRGARRLSAGAIHLRIGIDTGGTFTDFVLEDARGTRVHKVPSTPSDPSRAVLSGLAEILSSIPRVDLTRMARRGRASIVHGTTVGTNALLTRSGSRTAFVTTRGFEDLIEIARQNRPSLYDLDAARADPLVPRELRFGLRERRFVRFAPGAVAGRGKGGGRAPRGEESVRPSARALESLRRALRRARVESVAVGFLHSYVDPRSEEAVRRALAPLGVPITISSSISREYREYERFSTAIANAFLRPAVGDHLAALDRGARPLGVKILQSDGTTATPRAAGLEPVRTVLSGPAGGALAAEALARRRGDRRILSFDMGGTSTDVALIDGGLPRTGLGRIAGHPVRSPMLDIHTVGAGGGSIARRDRAGALRVGPDSAGADPGPACYGKGEQPTVTDAHILTGRLGAEDLLGGSFRVDRERARRAIAILARALGLSAERCAEGILEVVEATMERALRGISLDRGKDPRRYVLVAFGGAGGLHACALAGRLGIRRVVVPCDPGTFSATGLASASPGVETTQTVLSRVEDAGRGARVYRSLERQALAKLKAQGVAGGITIARFADLRYEGQSHEITVPCSAGMARAFVRAHRARYGHVRAEAGIELVTARVRASARATRGAGARRERPARGGPVGAAMVPILHGGRWVRAIGVRRDLLRPGVSIAGPARLSEYSSTTYVPPGWRGVIEEAGDLVLFPGRRGE